jgi:hypothetical protein
MEILGLLIFIADLVAIVKVVGSAESPGVKALWVAIILLLPLVGLIAWLVAGPGRAARAPGAV